MKLSRIVEYAFFFGLLVFAGYMVWQIISPFISTLALSIIIVTICNPLYEKIRKLVPKENKSIAAFVTTMIVLTVIVIPLILISSLVVKEIVNFYQDLDTGGLSIQPNLTVLEAKIQQYVPGFEINLADQIKRSAEWLTGNLGAIFAGTVSTIFIFFISLIGCFYFFRDGKEMLKLVVKASPLPDKEDAIILGRMARAVRSVATGTLLVALIQGTLVAIGFTIFDVNRAILYGSIAAVGALIPGIGTTIVTAPAIIYHFFTGDLFNAIGLLTWSMLLVGLVDNLIGPYLISRGNKLHPFIILISVLGGISLFGPIGFIVGPVVVTLFIVLLEMYNQYIINEKPIVRTDES
ncbi:AI-2E family transporter [Candidatus Kaiserbacteria bacterium]|nr:AI-2E family transporter [Candidatus Kaiserbacteria bacterium]USN92090.1 MAG: AI-2E family transporter [Candidatus Nomurabacteria bacterium]